MRAELSAPPVFLADLERALDSGNLYRWVNAKKGWLVCRRIAKTTRKEIIKKLPLVKDKSGDWVEAEDFRTHEEKELEREFRWRVTFGVGWMVLFVDSTDWDVQRELFRVNRILAKPESESVSVEEDLLGDFDLEDAF